MNIGEIETELNELSQNMQRLFAAYSEQKQKLIDLKQEEEEEKVRLYTEATEQTDSENKPVFKSEAAKEKYVNSKIIVSDVVKKKQQIEKNIIDYENSINANKYRLRALEQLAQLKNAQLGLGK